MTETAIHIASDFGGLTDCKHQLQSVADTKEGGNVTKIIIRIISTG